MQTSISLMMYNVFYVYCTPSVMESQKSENTRLDNSTYNVMVALGREADFLHSTIDTYIADAQKENKNKLVEVWNNINYRQFFIYYYSFRTELL
jgi:hypothetical protein